MANPQGDRNYTKISNEIIEALSKTDLSNYEFRVFIMILRKTYGFHKKKDWISLSQLAEITGIKLPHISRTIKKLKEKNMILKNGKVTGIQKDYELWKLPKQVTNLNEEVTQTGITQTGNVTQTGCELTQTGKKKLPKQAYTKDTIKDTNTKDKIHTPKKIKYEDFVSMTEDEYQKLISKYGEVNTKAFIEKLNVFKGANGKKYKSDYMAILNWVVEAVLSKGGGKNVNNSGNIKRFANQREDTDERVNKNFYIN